MIFKSMGVNMCVNQKIVLKKYDARSAVTNVVL